jgi:hypothetical protein
MRTDGDNTHRRAVVPDVQMVLLEELGHCTIPCVSFGLLLGRKRPVRYGSVYELVAVRKSHRTSVAFGLWQILFFAEELISLWRTSLVGPRRAQPAGFVYSRSRVVEAALFFTALYAV